MRRPRSLRDAALLGVLSGLNPFGTCGRPLLDWAYALALCAFLGMCLAFATAGCAPACATPATPSTPSTPSTSMDPSLLSPDFLRALARVESGCDDAAYNPAERAVGRYQIRQPYLSDANEALGTNYSLLEMSDPAKAEAVVRAYLTRWGEAFERRTGQPATAEILARIHNGGPRGAEKAATLGYAERFRREATCATAPEERELSAALWALEMMRAQVAADERLLRETRERLERNAAAIARLREELSARRLRRS